MSDYNTPPIDALVSQIIEMGAKAYRMNVEMLQAQRDNLPDKTEKAGAVVAAFDNLDSLKNDLINHMIAVKLGAEPKAWPWTK